MKLFYDPATGALVRLLRNAADEAKHGVPAGASVLEFDEETNAEAVAKLRGIGALWQDLRVVGGTLQHNGVPVALQPDGDRTQARKALDPAQVTQALADLDQIITLMDGSPTAAQQRAAVKRIAQIQRALVRRVVYLMEQE